MRLSLQREELFVTECLWRFSSGKYPEKTVEEVFLRDAPHLYRLKAARKSGPMVEAIDELRRRLWQKKIVVRCEDCSRRAQFVTFPVDKYARYWGGAYWWCDRH